MESKKYTIHFEVAKHGEIDKKLNIQNLLIKISTL